jgi:hypothetical protein
VSAAPVADRPNALARWAALGGVGYVVCFVVGTILAFGGQPDTDSPPAKIVRYYSDSGHRHRIAAGWFVVLVGILLFLWFLAALRQAVIRRAGPGVLAAVTTVGGAVYAACTLVGFSVEMAVKTMSDDTYRHQVYPELIHAADDAGYVIHSAGGAAIAAMFIASSLAALGARAVPAWLGWLGVLAGVAAFFSIFFFPWFVIAVWILVASGLLLRTGERGLGAERGA